jgi:putative tricarboxylic transport membrane protein
MSKVPTRQPGELPVAMLFFAISLALLYSAYGISGFSALSGPGTFPLAATSIMVVSSASVLLRTARMRAGDDAGAAGFFDHVMPPLLGIFIGLIAVYAVLFASAGFLIASLVFLTAGFHLLRRRHLAGSILLAIVSLVVVYVVFRLVFKVILPEGIVPEGELVAMIGRLLSGGAAQ